MNTTQKATTVTVYSMPDCLSCETVKRYFGLRGVQYHEKNVKSDPNVAAEARKKAGTPQLPVIEIDGEVVVGFNQQAIDALLFAPKPK